MLLDQIERQQDQLDIQRDLQEQELATVARKRLDKLNKEKNARVWVEQSKMKVAQIAVDNIFQ